MSDRKKVFLGIMPTLWSNDDMPLLGNEIPFEQCISEIALAGFEGCGVGHTFPKDTAVLKKALSLRGLKVSEHWAGTYFTANEMNKKTLEDITLEMDFMKELGGNHLVITELGNSIHQLPINLTANKPRFTQKQWDSMIEGLNRVGKLAEDRGMILCYRPHMGTGVQSMEEINRLMSDTDPKFVYLLLDTGHLFYSGEDPLEITRAHAKRIRHVHLMDVRKQVMVDSTKRGLSFLDSILAGVFTVPGDGAIDFKPILDSLLENRYEGWLTVEAEQDPAKANPLEYAKKARSYLRKIADL